MKKAPVIYVCLLLLRMLAISRIDPAHLTDPLRASGTLSKEPAVVAMLPHYPPVTTTALENLQSDQSIKLAGF